MREKFGHSYDAPPPPATDPHEPKDPRVLTREAFSALLGTLRRCEGVVMRGVVEGDLMHAYDNALTALEDARAEQRPMPGTLSYVAAERDEWKRRAEYGQCAEIAKCPTYYDGCHCTAATVQHNIERADKAEAERDAALAALRAQGEIRLDIRHASDLKLRVGVLLQLHWKDLTNEQFAAIKAICDEALAERP